MEPTSWLAKESSQRLRCKTVDAAVDATDARGLSTVVIDGVGRCLWT